MLKSMHIENLTVFPQAELKLGNNLNVIVGENGSGKSHILKAAYVAIAVGAARQREGAANPPNKSQLQRDIAEKLQSVFLPDSLGRLVSRTRGRNKCTLDYEFDKPELNLTFNFSTQAKTEVNVTTLPSEAMEKWPVFLPTRELLTIYPGFVSLYETAHLSYEETWRDTCILLGAPLARGPREATIKRLLAPLELAMGGKVELDRGGHFYLTMPSGKLEVNLVAEGLRKLATVSRLIATGSLLDKGYLFWDEPESNLNPKIIKSVAKTILQLADSGIQVFIATHSLFVMRELHIIRASPLWCTS